MQRVRRRVEPDVGARSAARTPGARAGPASSRAGCPATRGPRGSPPSPARGPSPAVAVTRASQAADRNRPWSGPVGSIGRPSPAWYLHARNADQPLPEAAPSPARRPPPPARERCRASTWPSRIPLFLFTTLAPARRRRRDTRRSPAYSYLVEGPRRTRKQALETSGSPADGRVRPDRQGPAGPPRRRPPRGRDLRPRSRPRSSTPRRRSRTRRSGRTRASIPPASSRRPSTRSRATTAAAPRSPSSSCARACCPPSAFDGQRLRAQGQGDHPVDPPDRGLPGRGRQAGDHGEVPQPELLRQPELRRRGRRPELLEQGPQGPHARPDGAPRRHPPVAHPLRPRHRTPSRRTYKDEKGNEQDAPRRPADQRDRPAPQLHPRAHEDALGRARPAGTVHGRRLRGGQGRARDPRRRRRPTQWRAPQFVWQVREELGQILCGDATQCEKIDTGGYKVITTLDYRMQRIVEKWVYAAAIIPNSKNPDAHPQDRADPAQRVVLDQGPARATTSTTPPRASSTTGPARSSPTPGSASYTAKGNKKFQPQFDVLGRRLAPARVVDQAARLPHRHRRQDDDGVHDVHGRRHQLRPSRREGRSTRPRPTAPSAGRSGCAARSSSRSTSRRSRPASSTASTTSSSAPRTSASTYPKPAPRRSRPRASAPSRCTRST